jgi:hypothetical protein
MRITQAEYQKLRPLIIELSHKRGHPKEIRIGELTYALGVISDPDLDSIMQVCWKNLPSNCESAIARILERLEQEVFDCTGKYPDTSP